MIIEVIEEGRVLDIYPDDGCVMFRVRGNRTNIEYIGCAHQMLGACPRIYDTVAIERRDLEADGYSFMFSTFKGGVSWIGSAAEH